MPTAFIQHPGRPGMFGALMDEYARAAEDFCRVVDWFDASRFDGSAQREIVLRPGTPKEKHLTGDRYLLNYGLPQFFFHVTTAYALLRHSGVEIGKRDYMGAY